MAALAAFVVATGLVVAPNPVGAQLPDGSTALPGLVRDMVVDPASQQVFVSLDNTNKVVALDFAGNVVATLKGEAGARGLAVVGSHLYVAAQGADAIDEVDTSTLTVTRTLATGLTGIDDLVAAGGALWVVQGQGGDLTRVSLTDGSTISYPNPLGYYGTGLEGDAADRNTILEYTPGSSPVTVGRIDVSTDPPTLAVSKILTSPNIISNVWDIAVSPDGSHLIPSGGAPYEFDEFNTSDLQPTGLVYPANPYPTSIAMTSARGGLLAGGMNGLYDADIVVYRLGDTSAPIATHDFGSTGETVESGGVAFSPDGSRVFAVTGDHGFTSATDTFHVLALPAPGITISPASSAFGNQRVGTYGNDRTFTITNTGTAPATLDDLTLSGANPVDFFGGTDCFPSGRPRVLTVGATCHVAMYFGPLALGSRHATLVVHDDVSGSPASVALSGSGTEGYYLADARGEVGTFGDAAFYGSAANVALSAPIISLATTPNGAGYWLLARDGGVFSFGNAAFHGSTGAIHLNKPIVAMTPTASGDGYWLVASDGGIFSFGDAKFHGSTGAMHLNKPIVGMAATPSGNGYWLVASDGGIFSFGDAKFYGSTGNIRLARPITSMTTTATGRGYAFVASDGGAFTFGDAQFYGSAAASGATVVGIASTPRGRGYWMASRTGQVFAFGDAPFYGDARSVGAADVIGIAPTAPPIPPDLLGSATVGADAVGDVSLATRGPGVYAAPGS